MSTTHFTSIATAKVSTSLDLNEYLTSLADFVSNHLDDLNEDIAYSLEDLAYEDTLSLFKDYVGVADDGTITIACDSDESNGNSVIWDWLCDQIRENVMVSKTMKIASASYNTRWGMDSSSGFYTKNGDWYSDDDLMKIVEDNNFLTKSPE